MRYVSDILAELLDAEEVRRLVRAEIGGAISDLPSDVRRRLAPLGGYYGGKCMGFPAIWLLKHALGLDRDACATLIHDHRAVLWLCLTTSIADDIIDGDEAVSREHMCLWYQLVFEALAANQWTRGGFDRAAGRVIGTVMREFLCSNSPREDLTTTDRIRTRGNRIGRFHGLIARSVVNSIAVPRTYGNTIVETAEKFGVWCAHLDDLLDVYRDRQGGEAENVILVLLAAHQEGQLDKSVAFDARAFQWHLASHAALITEFLDRELALVTRLSCNLSQPALHDVLSSLPSALPDLVARVLKSSGVGPTDGTRLRNATERTEAHDVLALDG